VDTLSSACWILSYDKFFASVNLEEQSTSYNWCVFNYVSGARNHAPIVF